MAVIMFEMPSVAFKNGIDTSRRMLLNPVAAFDDFAVKRCYRGAPAAKGQVSMTNEHSGQKVRRDGAGISFHSSVNFCLASAPAACLML